ncbi:MAG: hypothetical protein SLAVMIC_00634 [uncultured marine phage]|uniref:Uncharacterized protein n=1 Tax=uncultured marine phage TaxID=707152 RepID=A0A8D9C994_9VIRU|nr:MAG: hypothetical protein SLAVMIC_00634 [uncultured marine phage]
MYYSKFKKFGGEFIPNIVDYLMEIYEKEPGITISIGNDSVQKRRRTVYASTIVIHNQDIRNGAHVVFYRESVPKIYDSFTRLYQESEYMRGLGEWLNEKLEERGFVRNDITELERKKYKFGMMKERGEFANLPLHKEEEVIENLVLSDHEKTRQYKCIDIHVDFNPKEWSDRKRYNKSNKVYEISVPWLRGMGYRVYPKPLSYAATSAADLLLK